MKTVLVGINSKFIHTCLAIWYLKASVLNESSNDEVITREFSINDLKDNILSEIYKEEPDILAFSCYIWNIEIVHSLSIEIKKLLPNCTIILGGPEVSYDPDHVLKTNCYIDFVLSGEGEKTFSVLYKSLIKGSEEYKELGGIAYKEDGTIIFREKFNLVDKLDEIPSPYTPELMKAVSNRIVYYESSRGCPFSCSYCISSTFNGVRYFSFERVRSDLSTILSYSPKLIKFVDRTFNCNKQRAKEILRYIISLESDTVFHFEAAADLFDEELLQILKRAKKGNIQLEIGLQTTNIETLAEIDRVTDLEKLSHNVRKIISYGNIHVHLDLIAGLPYEDLDSFEGSFNDVYTLGPHQLQLGFLKLLKGSKIRNQAQKHGFKYRDYSPYEVLENNYISFNDILVLKDIEEVLERYFNSSKFSNSLDLMEKLLFANPFEMFNKLSVFCRAKSYLDRPISYRENIAILFEFFKSTMKEAATIEMFRQKMVFDFLISDSSCSIPECLKNDEDLILTNVIHQMLKNEEFVKTYLPEYAGIGAKNILKKVFFIRLNTITKNDEILLVDYNRRDLMNGKFDSTVIKI